jgi:hypothetical protein
MTAKKYLMVFTIIFISSGCTNGMINIEEKRGEVIKVHIKTPFDQCRLRGKHDQIKVKCKWLI